MSTTALAPAPTRASNSFTLAFGVLNIPLSVYTGTEETRVTRKEFILDGKALIEVGRSPIRKDNGEVINSVDVLRHAEASNGEWVTLTDDEIAEATCPKGIGDIVSFVPVKNVGNYLAEGQVQVRPKSTKGKVDAAGEKAFGLLLSALKRKKVVALVKLALRGPARYALLHADGTLVFVHSADQVREARELNTKLTFSDAEAKLADALIDAVGIDTPVLTDETASAVQAYVDSKAKGVAPAAAPIVAEAPIDLIAALNASLDEARSNIAKGKVA